MGILNLRQNHRIYELNFASLLLKLENYFHVPSAVIDELLIKLHYLLSIAYVPLSNSVIQDVSNALSSFDPFLKAVSKNGPLSTAFKWDSFIGSTLALLIQLNTLVMCHSFILN